MNNNLISQMEYWFVALSLANMNLNARKLYVWIPC